MEKGVGDPDWTTAAADAPGPGEWSDEATFTLA